MRVHQVTREKWVSPETKGRKVRKEKQDPRELLARQVPRVKGVMLVSRDQQVVMDSLACEVFRDRLDQWASLERTETRETQVLQEKRASRGLRADRDLRDPPAPWDFAERQEQQAPRENEDPLESWVAKDVRAKTDP